MALFAVQLFLRLSCHIVPLKLLLDSALPFFPMMFQCLKNACVFVLTQRKHQCDISAPFTKKLGLPPNVPLTKA